MDLSYYKIDHDKILIFDSRMNPNYQDIDNIFKLYDAIDGLFTPPASAQRIELLSNLKRKADDCRHKVLAVKYALDMIDQEMLNYPTIEDFKKYFPMILSKNEFLNSVLIYETESFLFQVMSNIDIIVQMLKYIYPYLDDKKGYDSESFIIKNNKTTNKMRDNSDKEMAEYFEKQIDEWISELNDMRNIITHRSSLIGFTSFVFYLEPQKIEKPKMPNGRNVSEYCHDIFKKLLILYKIVAEKFILPKLKQNM